MERGFVLDHAHGPQVRAAKWAEGQPERSFWTGIKLKGKRQLEVATYRCTRCGYLEAYAPPPA
jgi:hypothetical protein